MTGLLAATAGLFIAAGGVVAFAAFLPSDQSIRPPSRARAIARRALRRDQGRKVLLAVALALLVLLLTRWPIAALATGVGTIAAPRLLSRRPAQQRIARLEALESWTRKLADVLAASRALEDALMLSVRKAPAPIQQEVETLARRLRAHMPTEQALRLWAEDLADPTADRIAGALILAASRRGSGVKRVLTQLAEMVAKDVAARREVEASRAQHRTTLRWILIFLAGYTLFVSLRHSYSAPFDTFAGQIAMGIVALLYAAGLWWIHRLATPPKTPRLLTLRPEPARPSASPTSAREGVST